MGLSCRLRSELNSLSGCEVVAAVLLSLHSSVGNCPLYGVDYSGLLSVRTKLRIPCSPMFCAATALALAQDISDKYSNVWKSGVKILTILTAEVVLFTFFTGFAVEYLNGRSIERFTYGCGLSVDCDQYVSYAG
jgi:hypothetical protein